MFHSILLKYLVLIIWVLNLFGCGLEEKLNKKNLRESPSTTLNKEVSSGVDHTTQTTINADATSTLAGSYLAIDPGSFVQDIDVRMTEAVSLADLENEAELDIDESLEEAGPAVLIDSSAYVEAINPFTIALPYNPNPGLIARDTSNFIVMFKKYIPQNNGEVALKLGFIAKKNLEVTEDSVRFSSRHFGVYQVVNSSSLLAEEKEVNLPEGSIIREKKDESGPFYMGSWASTCSLDKDFGHYMIGMTFNPKSYLIEITVFPNKNCRRLAYKKSYIGIYKVNLHPEEDKWSSVVFENSRSRIRVFQPAALDAFNKWSMCNVSDWEIKKTVNIKGTRCDQFAESTVGKQLLYYRNDKLYLGKDLILWNAKVPPETLMDETQALKPVN